MEDMIVKDSVRFKVKSPRMTDDGGRFTVNVSYDCRLLPDSYERNESIMRGIAMFIVDDWSRLIVPIDKYSIDNRICKASVYRWIREGKLHTVKICNKTYIIDFDVNRLVNGY